MSHRSCALVLAIAGATAVAGQTVTPAQRSANLQSFEEVWNTVRDKHWDPKLGGLDWQAVHDELRPKMEAAKTADEGRVILNDMVGRLKQTHFGIFPGSVYHDLDASADSGAANPGIDVRILEGHAIVTEVNSGSPAAAKGVKPGWEILRVGGYRHPRGGGANPGTLQGPEPARPAVAPGRAVPPARQRRFHRLRGISGWRRPQGLDRPGPRDSPRHDRAPGQYAPVTRLERVAQAAAGYRI